MQQHQQILIVVWLALGVLTGGVASTKNRNVAIWGALGLLFGLIALIVVACLPQRRPTSAW